MKAEKWTPIHTVTPAYKAWSSELLEEREDHEVRYRMIGDGTLISETVPPAPAATKSTETSTAKKQKREQAQPQV